MENKRKELIESAGRALDKARMIRFNERTGYMFATDLGRTSSHFYIKYDTVEVCLLKTVLVTYSHYVVWESEFNIFAIHFSKVNRGSQVVSECISYSGAASAVSSLSLIQNQIEHFALCETSINLK